MWRYVAFSIFAICLFFCACSENGTKPTLWADEVAYDNVGTRLQAETAQHAIDELSSGSLARDIVGRWEGYSIDIDGATGEEIDCPDVVVFEFSEDGTYHSNFDTTECAYGGGTGPEKYLWEGRYWVYADNLLVVIAEEKAVDIYGRIPILVSRDGTRIVLHPLSTVSYEFVVLEKVTED